jgi:hypothetical protein
MTKHQIEERLKMLMEVLEDTGIDICADNEGCLFLRTYTTNIDTLEITYTGDYTIVRKETGNKAIELPCYEEFELELVDRAETSCAA